MKKIDMTNSNSDDNIYIYIYIYFKANWLGLPLGLDISNLNL